MPGSLNPSDLLRRDREAAARLSEKVGKKRALEVLRGAARDLEKRLRHAESIFGPGRGSFTAVHARATLLQVRAVLRTMEPGLKGAVVKTSDEAAVRAARAAARYLRVAEAHFSNSTQRLRLDEAALFDAATAGSKASVLRRLVGEGGPKAHGILERYGEATVGHFERALQKQVVARKPAHEVREELIAASPFLKQAPAYWAERIVRTEGMHASNQASFGAIQEADDQLGDMVKILMCVNDARTGCLLGETPVTSGVVRAVFRRPYEGAVLHLVTESGRQLTATPNHPMLTRRGWVSADGLYLDDYLICDDRQEHTGATRDEHGDHRPPTIGEVFDSLAARGVRERRRGRQEDFHGDGSDREVDVLRSFDELRLGRFSALDKPRAQHVFAPPDDVEFCTECGGLLSADAGAEARRFRAAAQRHPFVQEATGNARLRDAVALADSPDGISGVILPSYLSSGKVELEGMPVFGERLGLSLGSGSGDTSRAQLLVDVPVVGAHSCRDLMSGHPGAVKLDRLVSVEVRTFRGHVFNLSTEDGYFAAGGIYTGNSDSLAVHGQIRRVAESFDTWYGPCIHPPDRPNDRGVVVPHRKSWPIPAALNPYPASMVGARWALEGRKGGHPAIPQRSTIPLSEFGKPQRRAPEKKDEG